MRLSLVAPALTLGLLTGWAALANADAPPPAAPIFYCPTPGKAAPAPTPAAAPTQHGGAHLVRVGHERHHGAGCPTLRVAANHHPWRGEPRRVEGPPRGHYDDRDVSASQAFIYRYERAINGFDARAADEAWADGRDGRHCPRTDGGCPEAWRHDGGAPPHAYVEQAPLPPLAEHHAYVEHVPPAAPPHAFIERPLPPPAPPPEHHVYVQQVPARPPVPPPPPRHDYAWQDREAGASVSVERGEHASGWSYQEENGQGHYQHWSDGGRGDTRHDGDDDYWTGGGHNGRADDDGDYARRRDDGGEAAWERTPRRGPCPPVQNQTCTAGLTAHHGSAPAYPVRREPEVYTTAGRDAQGYLTWPGKTPADDR